MLYPKNVPNIERIVRTVVGVAMIIVALFGAPLIGDLSPIVAGVLILSAITLIVTGFIGWCPACAMVGRKLKSKSIARHEN
jgi:hypothetical protein